MRATVPFLFAILPALVCGQTRTLAERIRQFRAGIATVPTDERNYQQRVQLIEEWGADLSARGILPHPQDVMRAFFYLPTADARGVATIARWERVFSFLEDHGAGRTGTLRRIDSNDLIAARYATIVLEYTVGEVEIPTGNGLRIGQSSQYNRPGLQNVDAFLDSYVTFRLTSRTATTEPAVSMWHGVLANHTRGRLVPMPALRVTSGRLVKGDKVVIMIGDKAGGSAGFRTPHTDVDGYRFGVEIDYDGKGSFVPAGFTEVNISGDEAAGVEAVIPSIVATGESFSVRLRVEDQYRNPARDGGGIFRITHEGKLLGEVRVAPGSNTGRLDGVKLDREGYYRFDVASVDGRLRGGSNPMLVERLPARRIYWGEMHGHSGLEEGVGSPAHYYQYARDFAYVDFATLTGHDAFLTKPGWDLISRETARANRPGSFVTFMGYEWTQRYTMGGHHNVFFKTDKGRYITFRDAPLISQLYQQLRAADETDNVLIIPHAHIPGDWNFNDSDMERLVEIRSAHGSFEYFGNRYLRRGYRMGLIGASDDHTGHPGYAPAMHAVRGGLAAVYAAGLGRDQIWQGLKQRATYATEGHRPVLHVTVDGKPVGGSVPAGRIPTLAATVLGTAAIDSIEVIRNGGVEYRQDYMIPSGGDQTVLQVMLHSATETPGDNPVEPLGGLHWRGWIEVENGRIDSIEPVGADSFADEFQRAGDRQVWFACTTRGDFDGVRIRLSDAAADARISIRLPQTPVGGGGPFIRSPHPPGQSARHSAAFRAADLVDRPGKFAVTPQATVSVRKVKASGPWHAAFQYRPAKPPAANDYYYLRVTQADGLVAWTSPVWIGDQAPRVR